MNVRKRIDYNTMYAELDEILSEKLPQMEEIHAIGRVICKRPEKGAAVMAAEYLQTNYPDRTGFSPRNVRRMRDFYKVYENDQSLLQLALNIGWTLNVAIIDAALTRAEQKWYLEQARIQHWTKTQLFEAIQKNAHQNDLREENTDAKKDFKYTPRLTGVVRRIANTPINRILFDIQGLCCRKLLLC